MANEIQIEFAQSKTIYVQIFSAIGQVWNNSTNLLENYNSANYANYALSMIQQGTGKLYLASVPSAVPPGTYSFAAFQQLGGSAAESDPVIGNEDGFGWNGSTRVGPSDLATSGQLGSFAPIKIYRGEALPSFPFTLVGSVDHVTPLTSGVVSGQIVRDPVSGSTFGPLQSGIFNEIGMGWYTVYLTSGDLLANAVALTFSAVGADNRNFAFILQKTSGST